MIFDLIFYIIGSVLFIFSHLLPTWTIYPPEVTSAFVFFGKCFYQADFILPGVLTTLILVVLIATKFEAALYTVKLVELVINFFRGSGKVEL